MEGTGVYNTPSIPLAGDKYYGRTIYAAKIINNRLMLTLDGPQDIYIWDSDKYYDVQRYMSTDDDLTSLVGHKLVRIEAKGWSKDEPNEDDSDDNVRETCFVEIGTDDGFVTIVNHNEHNGYYGGFALIVTEE